LNRGEPTITNPKAPRHEILALQKPFDYTVGGLLSLAYFKCYHQPMLSFSCLDRNSYTNFFLSFFPCWSYPHEADY
jgi:hypothetical protein